MFDNEHALGEYQLAYQKHEACRYETLLRRVRLHNDMGVITLYKDKPASEAQYRLALVYADTLKQEYPDSVVANFWYAAAKRQSHSLCRCTGKNSDRKRSETKFA